MARRRALKFLLLLFVVASTARKASAQTLHPVIAGMPVYCTDPSGAPVYTAYDPSINDVAMSSILPNGARVIALNPATFPKMPPLIQLFIYAHECGHHLSGDIIAGVLFHEDNLNREKNADRIGIRLMRDQLHISPQQAAAISSTFQNNPPMFPYYLPGPLRAQWIRNCYATDNDDCTPANSSQTTGQPDDTSTEDANQPQATAGGDFCARLHSIMQDTPNGFARYRGHSTDEETWEGTLLLPNLEDCSINVLTGSNKYYECSSKDMEDDSSADSMFDNFKSKVRSCLGSDWTVTDGETSSGNPYGRYEKDDETSYVEVKNGSASPTKSRYR